MIAVAAAVGTLAAAIAVAVWLVTRIPADDASPCHRAPSRPYTVAEAHETWQDLLGCDTHYCAAKNAAYWTLADAGELVPDGRVERADPPGTEDVD